MNLKRIFIFATVLFWGIAFSNAALSAWVDAPAAPPGYGTPPLDQDAFKPLNLSNARQAKVGALGIGAPLSATFPDSLYKLDVAGDIRANSFVDDFNSAYYIDPGGLISGKVAGSFTVNGALMSQGFSVCLFNGAGCPPFPASHWTLSGTNLYPNLTTYNVGIGTASPSYRLHVSGGMLAVDSGVGGLDTLMIRDGSIQKTAGDSFVFGSDIRSAGTTFHLGAGSNQAVLNVLQSGNVGIGTMAPAHKLDVEGNAEFGAGTSNLELVQNGQTFEIRHHDPGIAWRDISLNPYGGNVGIGTTAPGYKLDVVGDIRANGGWFRNNGPQGWYNDTFGSGLYMTDTSWIRSYGGAGLWFNSATIGTNGSLSLGYGGTAGPVGGAIIAGNVGIGVTDPGGNKIYVLGTPAANTAIKAYSWNNGVSIGVWGEGSGVGIRGVSSGTGTGVAGVGGKGGYFQADTASGYNLHLPARNNAAAGVYLYVSTTGCPVNSALALQGSFGTSASRICVVNY